MSVKIQTAGKLERYEKIRSFLLKPGFNGFTKEDLFIMSIIKKGWGHDIAALSNMAEALVNLSITNPHKTNEYWLLLNEVVNRALHPKVRPYKKNIDQVNNLGKYGYYLEHLNIILGAYKRMGLDKKYDQLNERVSLHLLENSMSYTNYHADLLPNVKMKWSADQAAIRAAVSSKCCRRSLISVPSRRPFASSTALSAMATANRAPFSGSPS